MTRDKRPVVFLDLDDTVCLNAPYGGYDVVQAAWIESRGGAPLTDHTELWAGLFDAGAVHHLASLHDEFRPWYVLSTSWAWMLDEATLRRTLVLGGLDFVASHLHRDWDTPKTSRPGIRWHEIRNWLGTHPEFIDRWVILDDELSGTGTGLIDPPPERKPFIVICKVSVGLTEVEYRRLRAALLVRAVQQAPL